MEEIIIIFVEGHGEHIFFKKLIEDIEKNLNKKIKEYEIENLKSIGRYKGKALRIYREKYKKKYQCKKIVLFNYDTDVFKKKPYPVDWEKVKSDFEKEDNNCEIYYLRVEEHLEDLLLLDLEGIMKFLNISKTVNEIKNLLSEKNSGVEKIKFLYREGSNIYTKSGRDLEELLNYLDMNKIITSNLECINTLIKKITY